MFFLMSITNGKKDIDYNGGMQICPKCGAYCNCEIFLTYMCLSLFFIPVFKWGKRYYVQFSCCGSVYEMPQCEGKKAEKGEDVSFTNLKAVCEQTVYERKKVCPCCGFEADSDFQFCPKCGTKF